jgi:hypothetical protein
VSPVGWLCPICNQTETRGVKSQDRERDRTELGLGFRGGAAKAKKAYELELEEVCAALRLDAGLHARVLVPHHGVAVVAHGGGGGRRRFAKVGGDLLERRWGRRGLLSFIWLID